MLFSAVFEEKIEPELSQQWSALRNSPVDVNAEFLNATHDFGLPFPPKRVEIIPGIYIRHCYKRWFDLFVRKISEHWKIFPISGTPGIGKSWLTIYLLSRIPHTEGLRTRSVLFHYAHGFFYFVSDGRALKLSESKAEELVSNESTIYIIDGSDAIPLIPRCTTIFISSPRNDRFRHWCKQMQMTPYYFPIWTLKELKSCHSQYYPSLSIAELDDRFMRYGGVPRFVFWSQISPLPSIDAAVSDADARKSLGMVGELSQKFRSSHMLLHLIVDDDFRLLSVGLSSDYIGVVLFERYYAETLERMQSLLGSGSTLSGHLFQCFMHYKFKHSSNLTFKCYSLEEPEPTEKSLSFGPLKFQLFSKLPDQLQNNIYYQPLVSNYPAFDAITAEGLLQFTTSKIHPIKGVRTLDKAIRLYNQRPVKFYFFVPQDIFCDFGKQPIQAETTPTIEQYVVKVSIGLPPKKRRRS